jgi:hypothetical protein
MERGLFYCVFVSLKISQIQSCSSLIIKQINCIYLNLTFQVQTRRKEPSRSLQPDYPALWKDLAHPLGERNYEDDFLLCIAPPSNT